MAGRAGRAGQLAEVAVAVIVLASESPRRAALLASAGLTFVVVPSQVAEERRPGETPRALVRRLAAAKARDVAASGAGRFALGADTTVAVGGEIFEKPRDDDDARAMLARLSGRVHEVLTGYEVVDAETGRAEGGVVATRVEFAALSRAEIDAYVATGEPRGKAGAYAIQGRAVGMIRRIDGSYSNVVGLPLREVLETLARMGAIAPEGSRRMTRRDAPDAIERFTPGATTRPVPVLIASYFEPEHVERIRAMPGVEVMYEPALLPKPTYPAQHHGQPFARSAVDERRWRALLARAEVLFDFDYTNLEGIPVLAPRVRWIQASSAGIGQLLVRTGLIDAPIVVTTASGIHAGPLAEWCVMAMLAFVKDLDGLKRDQAAHRWTRGCVRELRGMTLGVLGLGNVGREVARMGGALGMRVIGTKRTVPADGLPYVERVYPPDGSAEVIRESDVLVVIVPHTSGTARLLGERELRSMKRGAMFINIARGAVVDEAALVAALRDGHLGGAALDVFQREPPPPDSPLWDLTNVIVSPHSASTVPAENARLTDLFCENLRRYIGGEPLLNMFDRERMY